MINEIKNIIYNNDGKIINNRISEKFFKKNYYNLYEIINKKFSIKNFSVKLYCFYNQINKLPKCKNCKKELNYENKRFSFKNGFNQYCSMHCMHTSKDVINNRKNTLLKKYGVDSPLKSSQIKDNLKSKNIEKYGVEWYVQTDKYKEKNKKTLLEKYGVDHISKIDGVREKIENTNIKKYGYKSSFLNKEVQKKHKKTLLEKYGVNHISKIDGIREKIEKINLKKYGVRVASQSKKIKEKTRETNINKYGGVSPMSSELIQEKVKQTNLEKYGVENSFQNKEIINKILNTQKNSFKKKWSKFLNINQDDIEINNDIVNIKNYCHKHNEFEITKSLLYNRYYKYKINICTKCFPVNEQSSIKEKELINFIISLNIPFIQNDRSLLNGKELDIYIPSHNLAIEFNGLYWHSELFKNKNYHLDKTNLCNQKGVQLIHIFEDEWVYKADIVKSIIKSKLGLITNKIYARKCNIKEIDSKISKEFLNDNHLQGNVNSSIKLGLYYNNELVSVMSFGKKRKSMGSNSNEGEYEMYRFSNKIDTNIIGGASKLLKYFIKNYNPEEIISYADKRYSKGDLYERLGFKRVGESKPNYWYFNRNGNLERHYRFRFRKDILIKEGFDKNKTEHEIMLEREYLRIYDCGNYKFILK